MDEVNYNKQSINTSINYNFNLEQYLNIKSLNFLNEIKIKLKQLPEIISYSEILEFKLQLKLAKKNNNFILYLGECSESFNSFSEDYVKGYQNLFSQIQKNFNKDILKIARLAGQFAKPGSSQFEIKEGQKLLNYFGDIINDSNFDVISRKPDPLRFYEAYAQAAITKNYLDKKIYIAHEFLLIDYEECFIKNISKSISYSSSAHNFWVGYKTNFSNSKQIKSIENLINPVALKIGPDTKIKDLELIIQNKEINNQEIILIGRFGINYLEKQLKDVIKLMQKYSNIYYIIDPMHGNTIKINNFKRRKISDIKFEIDLTIKMLATEGLRLDGMMLESSFENVIECYEENAELLSVDCYKTTCDPRLNFHQTLDIMNYTNHLIK